MLNIAICESDGETRLLCKTLIADVAADYPLSYTVFECSSFAEMDNLLKANTLQILLLSTEIDGTTGIDYAKTLRKNGYKRIILFISNSKEYAVDAFDVSAFFYFLKPPERARFKFVFSRLFNSLVSKTDKTVTLKANNEYFTYKLKDIVFVSSDAHKITLHFAVGESKSFLMKLDEFEKFISSDSFIRLHKSYLANYKYITAINPTEATVNGACLPVSRALKNVVLDKYLSLTNAVKR